MKCVDVCGYDNINQMDAEGRNLRNEEKKGNSPAAHLRDSDNALDNALHGVRAAHLGRGPGPSWGGASGNASIRA